MLFYGYYCLTDVSPDQITFSPRLEGEHSHKEIFSPSLALSGSFFLEKYDGSELLYVVQVLIILSFFNVQGMDSTH